MRNRIWKPNENREPSESRESGETRQPGENPKSTEQRAFAEKCTPTPLDKSTLVPMQRLEQVMCRRIGHPLPIAQHQRCPYCFGHADEIANGQHERICDYMAGRDPQLFGFPEDATRECRG